MKNEQGYNGWTNYETWCVALWLNNEQSSYHMLRELARNEEIDDCDKAEHLRDLITDDLNPLADDASLYADLLADALMDVEWYEIIENAKEG